MKHLKLFSLLSIPSLALFAGGCGGSQTTIAYMVGYSSSSTGAAVAEEWQLASGSSTPTAMALSTPSGMAGADAEAVTVSGNDVYVAGAAENSTNTCSAVYWLNGAATTLPVPSGMVNDQVKGITVRTRKPRVRGQ